MRRRGSPTIASRSAPTGKNGTCDYRLARRSVTNPANNVFCNKLKVELSGRVTSPRSVRRAPISRSWRVHRASNFIEWTISGLKVGDAKAIHNGTLVTSFTGELHIAAIRLYLHAEALLTGPCLAGLAVVLLRHSKFKKHFAGKIK